MIPDGFIEALEKNVGAEAARGFVDALSRDPGVAVRTNPFKCPDRPLDILQGASRVPWNSFGWFLGSRPSFTLDPFFHAGAYYVQDSSAMFVGEVFRQVLSRVAAGPGARVLDLCAAPGGKTTDLSVSLRQRFGDDFLLVSNEVMRKRASVLADNVAEWGDPAVVVTSVDPSRFSPFEGFFDVIVADVPCSGEGMFRKDERACTEWSPDTVKLCAMRQRRIIADVWPALRKGGILIYSTCTFEEEENDLNFEWMLSGLGADALDLSLPDGVLATRYGALLIPGRVRGEGQWVAAAVKTSGTSTSRAGVRDLASLRPLRFNEAEGEWKGRDFVPNPDWALSLKYEKGRYPEVELDLAEALSFLHKDALSLPDAPQGYLVVKYGGLPLGFVKNLGKRANNLHPASRRILMDINK